jgi:hypothetical protein
MFALSFAPARVKPELSVIEVVKPTLPLSVRVKALLIVSLEPKVKVFIVSTALALLFVIVKEVAPESLSASIVMLCDPENVRLVRLLSVKLPIVVCVVFVELSAIVSAVALKLSVPKLNNPAPFRLIATEVRGVEVGLSFIAEIVKSWLAVAVMFSEVNALSLKVAIVVPLLLVELSLIVSVGVSILLLLLALCKLVKVNAPAPLRLIVTGLAVVSFSVPIVKVLLLFMFSVVRELSVRDVIVSLIAP